MHNGSEIIQYNDKKWQGERESQTTRALCTFLYAGGELAANQLITPCICLVFNQWTFAVYHVCTMHLCWPVSGL